MTDLTNQLLEWYEKNGRDMPWRIKGGAHFDPYAVWVSEIMLQQTTVQTVLDYFNQWMKRFPNLRILAQSDLDDVLKIWQGMGYYTRAKKMHVCAKVLMEKYNGIFPTCRDELLKLPGIGPYTASSLCALAFNQSETVVDGNVIRVIARLYALTYQVDKDDIYPLAQKLTSKNQGADYASAIMDLGAMVCKPKNPLCVQCPWKNACQAYAQGIYDNIPVIKKTIKKKKNGAAFAIYDEKNRLFIIKRQCKGLLSGLWEIPWTQGNERPPFPGEWQLLKKQVHHVFTHIDLTLSILKIKVTEQNDFSGKGRFVTLEELNEMPFSTLMKKVLKVANSSF